ncbi:uncharacterized protein LOC112568096 [Pomacea canaliculata]|uniref:uncharacterized protein LOC112568096 n=1 Tax=Pomacea canaliculata TaxID=400727 RepID=UPI000D7291C7|nr:uncharacterized protein LOC112568096 [Pomacea canaliculata]
MTMDKRLHVVLLAMVLTCMSSEAADDKPLVVSKNVDILPTEGVTVEEDIFRDKRYSDNKFCFAEGKTYRNGVTFTLSKLSPCVKYRCEEGTPKIVKEGCYVKQNDRCIQINAMTEIKCITYRCTKRGTKITPTTNSSPSTHPSARMRMGSVDRLGMSFHIP